MTIQEDKWYGNEDDRAEYCSMCSKQDIRMERNKMKVDPICV
jgi:hypothetical protein